MGGALANPDMMLKSCFNIF